MKKMKKIISVIAAMTMFLSTMPFASAANIWETTLDSNLVHIGVISDTHVISNQTANMTKAFQAFNDLAENSLAGVVLNGDIIYQYDGNGVSQTVTDVAYDAVFNSLESVLGQGYESFVWTMGNHEFPQGTDNADLTSQAMEYYKTKVGQVDEEGKQRYVADFDSYTVISAGAENYYGIYSAETEAWILEQIEAAVDADAEKPIFLALHHPLQGTVMNISIKSCSEEFITELKKYPQVINLASHIHTAAQNPATIRQDGFTSILTPYLGETGYIGVEGTKYDSSLAQALMLEIDPDTNIVKIYKLDVKNNEFIGNPFVIDVPGLVNGTADYLYTDERITNASTPAFPQNATATVALKGDRATITFPQAVNAAQSDEVEDGFVLYYKAKVINTSNNGVIAEKQLASGYHLTNDVNNMPETVTATIESLPEGTTCKVSIIPVSPFGKEGAAIETEEFTTLRKGEIPTDGTALELKPAKDATFKGKGWTALGPEAIGLHAGVDCDFEVYASEDGWYDIGVTATNWVSDDVPVNVVVNSARAARIMVKQTTTPDGSNIEYFEGGDFWPQATTETITGIAAEDKELTTNGHVWLTKGINYLRVGNDTKGPSLVLQKVMVNRNLECTDAVPTYHYYDTVEWTSSYNIIGDKYTQTDNRAAYWFEAPNMGATVQGPQIVAHNPYKANYRISVPVSGYYKMTFRAGNGHEGHEVSHYNVYINSSETPAATCSVPYTGGFGNYAAHDFGTIYLNKGVNLLTLHQTESIALYANAFSLELVEEKQRDISKYNCLALNGYAFMNDGCPEIFAENGYPILNFGGDRCVKFIVNATEAGWYNMMSKRGNFKANNVFTVEVNGQTQLNTPTPAVAVSLVPEDAKIGKVYLNEGANIIKITNSVAHSVLENVTFAKAGAQMYVGDAETTKVASGNLKATMGLNGEKEIGDKVSGIFAVYEDGKLAAVQKTDATLAAYCEEINVEIPNFVAKEGKTYTAKAFMWNSANSGISIDLTK